MLGGFVTPLLKHKGEPVLRKRLHREGHGPAEWHRAEGEITWPFLHGSPLSPFFFSHPV